MFRLWKQITNISKHLISSDVYAVVSPNVVG